MGLIAVVALVVAALALLNDRVSAHQQAEPPPSVGVQVQPRDRAEMERIVEERLRALEQDEADREAVPG